METVTHLEEHGTIVNTKLFEVNGKKQALIMFETEEQATEALVCKHATSIDRFFDALEFEWLPSPERDPLRYMNPGFAELEYAMLRYMGAIDDTTPVITSVHDQQLVDDIPVEKLLIHDVPVDIICTPTQVILTNNSFLKPQGIYWDKLSPEKLGQICILRELKSRIEQDTGQKLPCWPSGKLPATAQRRKS